MKYPKIIITDIKESYIYLHSLIYQWGKGNDHIEKNFKNLEFDHLIKEIGKIINNFEPIWKKQEKFILKEIPKISGFKWFNNSEVSHIHVYPIPAFRSFSHPLFLKVCTVKKGKIRPRPNGIILGSLIHELCHHNIKNLNLEREINETLIDFISLSILKKINKNYWKKQINFYEKVGPPIDFSSIPKPIKNRKKSIKEYYKNKKTTDF